jgi:hypothetical protein
MSFAIRQNPASADNYTIGRENTPISGIVIHHAATTDFDGIGITFANPDREASAHYGVGQNANVDQYVDEANTAWHANDWDWNLKTIGIENVDATGAPTWEIADTTFETLTELCRDIATRHNLLPLKVGVNFNLVGHKDVGDAATACPENLEPRLQELADAVNDGTAPAPAPTPVPTPEEPVDNVLHIGSHFVFPIKYRVDNEAQIGGIWQVQTNVLCPAGFTWNDNGIPVMPLTEVAGGTGNSSDQVLQIGSDYEIPGTYTVLNMGQYQGQWLAEIDMQGWKLWVDIASVTEVA